MAAVLTPDRGAEITISVPEGEIGEKTMNPQLSCGRYFHPRDNRDCGYKLRSFQNGPDSPVGDRQVCRLQASAAPPGRRSIVYIVENLGHLMKR